MRKKISSIVTSITIASIFLNHIQSIPVLQNAEAASFRTTYTVFGDLNDDKVIDSFDVILMRGKVADGKYDKNLDFNCDDKVDSDDLTLLSDYVLGKNCIFDAYLCEDADEDHICDMLEVAYLKTDPDSKDSDGDTLTDYDEIVYTNTSPTDKYTRKLTVTDADDDADGDKLTNKEELSLDTSPLLADSDEDEISDYEEINKYNTDPNDDDSDDDNITDGEEIKLGLKPDSDKSNGITYDYERTFNNKIPASSELLSYINVEESPYEVSIDIKSAGNVDKALSAHIGDFSNTSEDERVIGRSVSFSYDEKLSVDSAKIYFKPYDVNESIENYLLFQFFPETNYLLPVETKYTKDSAYVETSELGTFCLVDTKDLIDSKVPAPKDATNSVQILGDDIKVSSNDLVWDYTLDETEVLFYIDISNCATDTIESTKQSILDFSEALFEHCDNAAIQIIGYDLCRSKPQRVYFTNSLDDKILVDLNSVEEAIEKIATNTEVTDNNLEQAIYDLYNNNTGLIQKGLFSSECKNKYVFITSDSSLSLTQNHTGYYYNGVPKDTKEILEGMQYEGIHVNTLFSDNLLKNSRAVKGIKNFKDACDEYDFGVYTKSSTGYFGNTGYARVYSDAITDIQSLSVMYTCSVSPNAIPSSVERNAFINSLPSSYDTSKVPVADSNGNIPFKESTVKVEAATLDKNDNLEFKNLYSVCDESELTRKGYEQLTENMEISRKLVWDSFQITPFSDKILYDDKDGDGIPNKHDPYPDEPFDERFEIVDDYGHFPIMDFMIRSKLGTGSTEFNPIYGTPGKDGRELCYCRRAPEPEDYFHYTFLNLCAAAAQVPDNAPPGVLKTSRLAGIFAGKGPIPMPHSGAFLQWYLLNPGMKIIHPEDVGEIITTHTNNLSHYMVNVNAMIELCEEALPENQLMVFSSTHEDNFKVACYADKHGGTKCTNPNHYFEVDKSDAKITAVGEDWSYSIGDSFCGLVCSAVRSGSTYTMNYKIYLMDYYEWGYHVDSGDKELHMLNECGLAKEYPIYGVIENTITWKSGYRIKSPNEVKELVAASKKPEKEQIKDVYAELDKAVKSA